MSKPRSFCVETGFSKEGEYLAKKKKKKKKTIQKGNGIVTEQQLKLNAPICVQNMVDT